MKRHLYLLPLLLCLLAVPGCAEAAREEQARQKPVQTPPAEIVNEQPRISFPGDPVELSIPPVLPEQPEGPRFAVIPSMVRLGEPVTIAYTDDFSGPGSKDFQAVLIDSRGIRLARVPLFSFIRTAVGQEVQAAVLTIPTTAASGPFLIRIEAGGRTIQDLPLIVEQREFIYEHIPLDEKNTELRTAEDEQKDRESQILWAVLSRRGNDIYDGGPFTAPVGSARRTSFFGDRRLYEYIDGSTDRSIHAGIDYGVPIGTEVRACASGRVVLAAFRIVTGNSVVLEHFPGVYSLYYHMNNITVEENNFVRAGAVLGHSGDTGLATGPHLHWEIRVAGETADPDVFLSRPVLDKDEILRNLTRY